MEADRNRSQPACANATVDPAVTKTPASIANPIDLKIVFMLNTSSNLSFFKNAI